MVVVISRSSFMPWWELDSSSLSEVQVHQKRPAWGTADMSRRGDSSLSIRMFIYPYVYLSVCMRRAAAPKREVGR